MHEATSDQIEGHIRRTREDLRTNLEELEGRVRSTVDWRQQFRRNPALGIGLAVAAGFLVASVTARPRQRLRGERLDLSGRPGHLRHVWENVQSTLVGIAAARVSDLLVSLLAGRANDASYGLRDDEEEGVQGEGDYRAARRYRHSAERYARGADISRAARDAAPGSATEEAEMEQAEAAGRSRARG